MSDVKIKLFGGFGIPNFGNDASLTAILCQLRMRGFDVLCICTCPSNVAARHGVRATAIDVSYNDHQQCWRAVIQRVSYGIARRLRIMQPARLLRALSLIKRGDILLIPGTGILDDYATKPWDFPFSLAAYCIAARLRGARVIMASIGAGPIHHPLSRLFMKWAAIAAHYRSYRDHVSRDYMHNLGVDTRNDRVFPDIVFSLHVPSKASVVRRTTVAVGVMAYFGWQNNLQRGREIYENYIRKITEFILWLMRSGNSILLAIGNTHDQVAVRDIVANLSDVVLPDDVSIQTPRIDSFEELLMQFANVDVVVATRFHNVVAALLRGKPVYSLGYAEKNNALLSEMGLGKFCQHIENFDLQALQSKFNELMDQREMHSSYILTMLAEYRDQLDVQFDTILGPTLQTHPGCDGSPTLK